MPSNTSKKIGLTFRGGGYNVATFHPGTSKKLNIASIVPEAGIVHRFAKTRRSINELPGKLYCSFNYR